MLMIDSSVGSIIGGGVGIGCGWFFEVEAVRWTMVVFLSISISELFNKF